MKLNPDCIRDILLFVEANTSLNSPVDIDPDYLPEPLSIYSSDEVMYHIKQCELSALFGDEVSWYVDGNCMIRYLSPSGHQFLSDIRSDNAWNKTKEIAHGVGVNSIDAIKQIATGVISALIQKQLGLL